MVHGKLRELRTRSEFKIYENVCGWSGAESYGFRCQIGTQKAPEQSKWKQSEPKRAKETANAPLWNRVEKVSKKGATSWNASPALGVHLWTQIHKMLNYPQNHSKFSHGKRSKIMLKTMPKGKQKP